MSQASMVGSSLYSTPVMLFLRRTMAVTKSRYAACTGARGMLQACSDSLLLPHHYCSRGRWAAQGEQREKEHSIEQA